ncbi:cytochrome P450 [Halodurantibacterium flavum]|uniref:Cytochrome P450 n=1 Tax=Halodurantibacterium flavum TaxID=1382802 RepID=A0ABW4S5I2_9RHOB
MNRISQPLHDPAFVQNPYGFYDRARTLGPLVWWEEYGMTCAVSHAAVNQILRDRRFGREEPEELRRPLPAHVAPFYAVEAHSMLELEPPRHTRLRGLVLRAFTSRRIAALAPEIETLSHALIDPLPQDFDLLPVFAQKLPVIVIARLLGVPEEMSDQLLHWSNAMVRMYLADRHRATEDAAVAATVAFVDFLRSYVEERRRRPADDLITHLIAAEEGGEKLSTDELITTCILLLNAGHEATVHSLGIAVKTLLETGTGAEWLAPDRVEDTIEECLRHDPPLHLFQRIAYEDIEVMGHVFHRGDRVACLLGAANRDPGMWNEPHRFNPGRPRKTNLAFGSGLHFCVGAPLARLELQIALPILFARLPGLRLAAAPEYADTYHFHGLTALHLRRD